MNSETVADILRHLLPRSIQRLDFTGKKVLAAMTHEGSGLGSCEQDLKKLCPGAVLEKGLAVYGAEIPFVFRNTDDPLADQVSQVWVNFARNGVPSAGGMPQWEPYTREGGATMLLDDQPELVHHHDRELMKLLAPDYEY